MAIHVPQVKKPHFLLPVAFILLLFGSLGAAQDAQLNTFLASETALPSAQALKSCLEIRNGAECLDKLFHEALKTHSTSEALQQIQSFVNDDAEIRRDCHPIVHAIGRETYRIKQTIHDSFSACDQTCHSGCYHGSVERFLRGENIYSQVNKHPSRAELQQKAAIACDPNAALRFRFQCLHGLGHALLFFSGYKLVSSLEVCDALPDDWARTSCYGGVFMENVFNATPERRDLSPVDFHYPCNKIDKKYRAECYLMQTSRMTEMGLSTERIFDECRKAEEFREPCMISAGRDLSNDVRLGNTHATAVTCERVGDEARVACLHGVIYALIDNTWDGRYALPFCDALSQAGDQTVCFRDSIAYLKETFETAAKEIAADCIRHLPRPKRCVDLATR